MSNLETFYLLPQKYQLHNFIVDVTFILSHTYSIILVLICMCSKSLQSCLTLCDLMDCSLPGCSVHGILQARILEWIAMPCSRGSS